MPQPGFAEASESKYQSVSKEEVEQHVSLKIMFVGSYLELDAELRARHPEKAVGDRSEEMYEDLFDCEKHEKGHDFIVGYGQSGKPIGLLIWKHKITSQGESTFPK